MPNIQQSAARRITWTHGDHKHDETIPDIWFAGFCTSTHCTVDDAVSFWQSQSEMGCA